MGRFMKILVLKTSSDETMQKLFKELDRVEKKRIDCLIQSSQIDRYRQEYPDINFIDIRRERFENLSSEIMDIISAKFYDRLYITLSGVNGYHFWNVIEFVSKVHFRRAFFYNCNGEQMKIPKGNIIKDTLERLYIKWNDFII